MGSTISPQMAGERMGCAVTGRTNPAPRPIGWSQRGRPIGGSCPCVRGLGRDPPVNVFSGIRHHDAGEGLEEAIRTNREQRPEWAAPSRQGRLGRRTRLNDRRVAALHGVVGTLCRFSPVGSISAWTALSASLLRGGYGRRSGCVVTAPHDDPMAYNWGSHGRVRDGGIHQPTGRCGGGGRWRAVASTPAGPFV